MITCLSKKYQNIVVFLPVLIYYEIEKNHCMNASHDVLVLYFKVIFKVLSFLLSKLLQKRT